MLCLWKWQVGDLRQLMGEKSPIPPMAVSSFLPAFSVLLCLISPALSCCFHLYPDRIAALGPFLSFLWLQMDQFPSLLFLPVPCLLSFPYYFCKLPQFCWVLSPCWATALVLDVICGFLWQPIMPIKFFFFLLCLCKRKHIILFLLNPCFNHILYLYFPTISQSGPHFVYY